MAKKMEREFGSDVGTTPQKVEVFVFKSRSIFTFQLNSLCILWYFFSDFFVWYTKPPKKHERTVLAMLTFEPRGGAEGRRPRSRGLRLQGSGGGALTACCLFLNLMWCRVRPAKRMAVMRCRVRPANRCGDRMYALSKRIQVWMLPNVEKQIVKQNFKERQEHNT